MVQGDAFAQEQHELAVAKARGLSAALTAVAVGWPEWEPTPSLLLATADLAAAVARHLGLARAA